MTITGFCDQVRHQFGRHAAEYNAVALLQQAVAWRLAHHCRDLPLPAGPRADLGAGSGLLGMALASQQLSPRPGASAAAVPIPPTLQLDLCPELLARNPLAPGQGALVWDLNNGLPTCVEKAALLSSSFALQWLDAPLLQFHHWCSALREGGWLALAVPTQASFPQWHQAARRAAVPFTGLDLPNAGALMDIAESQLRLRTCQRLRFSRPASNGLGILRQIKQLGAGASRHKPLSPGQLRRLLEHWPSPSALQWEVLVLVGQRLGR